jgi:hypothetical protein
MGVLRIDGSQTTEFGVSTVLQEQPVLPFVCTHEMFCAEESPPQAIGAATSMATASATP